MGWVFVIISFSAAALMYAKGKTIFVIVAIITAVGSFWSYGIMHNYATESAKKRKGYKGGFNDFTLKEVKSVPDWITWINMSFSIIGFLLFVSAFFLR